MVRLYLLHKGIYVMQWIQEALKQETITVKKQLNQGLKELDKSQKAEKKAL